MLPTVVWFVLGLALLGLGGNWIVKGAGSLARHLQLSPFATGLVLIAFGTSLPELAVNLQAIAVGRPALALGNAVGSNIVNFGLTLGAAAVAAPLLVRWRALSPLLLCLIGGSVLAVVLGLDGELGRVDGFVLMGLFVAVIGYALVRTREEAPGLRAEIQSYAFAATGLVPNLFRVVVAVVLMFYGSQLVVGSAPALGESLGLLPLMTGLLPVAIGTALPEMAAAVAAARRGQGDMVAGHVIGSSLFNLLLIVGGMAAWRGVALPDSFVRVELPAAGVLALMLYPMLRGDLAVTRREGTVLLAAFAVWVALELLTLR